MYSIIKNENAWVNDFSCSVFFFLEASNSCGVLICLSFVLSKHKTNKTGRILILNMTLNADQYILINLYDANTDTKQINIFQNLKSLLKKINISRNKTNV